jgi:hypothetical protein
MTTAVFLGYRGTNGSFHSALDAIFEQMMTPLLCAFGIEYSIPGRKNPLRCKANPTKST